MLISIEKYIKASFTDVYFPTSSYTSTEMALHIPPKKTANIQPHLLRLLPPLIPNPMTNPKILLKKILRKIVKFHILGPQPIRRRNPTHTRHLMHINQRPTPRKEGVFLAV